MDVATAIETDHRQVETLFGAIESGAGDRKDLVGQVVRLLSVHALAEEQLVYPALREANGGEALADHAIDEHQEMKELLVRLDRGDPGDEDFESALAALMAAVRSHVPDEEGVLLPRLREVAGDDRMRELGEAFEKAKDKAPTHPHPHAPNTPPGNVVAGAVSAPVDKLRDKLGGS